MKNQYVAVFRWDTNADHNKGNPCQASLISLKPRDYYFTDGNISQFIRRGISRLQCAMEIALSVRHADRRIRKKADVGSGYE